MRILAAALGALAVAGCAASSPSRAMAPAGGQPTALHPIVAEATPAPAAETSPEQEPKNDHASRQMNRVWGWVALSVGAEGALLATITSFMMLHESSVRNGDCSDKVCSLDGITANTKLGDLAGWNVAGWAVAVVGVGTGAFLLLTNPSDKALGTQVGVGPTASGSGLLLRGSF
jgi:hypothetical protein